MATLSGEAWRREKARMAGACYLAVIAGGLFAQGVVRGRVIVPGSAEATALAVAAHEPLWRWGIAVHLAYLVATVPMAVLLCEAFRPVGAALARSALVFAVMCSTIEAMSLLLLTVPLAIADGRSAFPGLDAGQGEALGYVAVRLFGTGFGFGLLFFAGFCILVGLLAMRSRIVPTPIGPAMVLAGLCYFVNTVAGIVVPDVAGLLFPWILLPCFAAELSLALWLLLGGAGLKASRGAASTARS